ncbi:MAG: hypothetical protein HY011_13495 [Acidobacteria bacterium]|nr:hypothetical protein [Acidobacteriota bacterium]
MSSLSRRNVALGSLLAVLAAVGCWFYSQRVRRVSMAQYVPASALGFVEVNNVPQVLEQLTATNAWRQLAPAYGLSDKLNYASKLGGLAQFAGALGGEATLLARAQFAVAVTALEVHGEQIKPRWALVAETHTGKAALQSVIEKRLPELAWRAFGQFTKREQSEHSGVPVVIYKSAADGFIEGGRDGKQLLSAQMGSVWLLANHPEAMRACIETRLGHAPSLASNAYLPQARAAVERSGEVFGFITGEGVTRLLRFGSFMLAGGAIGSVGKAALAGAVGDIFSDFSAKSADGIAYGVSFENGAVVDRYELLLKPDLTESLRAALKVNTQPPRVLTLLPATVREVTLLNLENPGQAFGTLETAISARVGAGQSFILRQFLSGMQEAFFGLRANELAVRAIGEEVASLNFTDDVEGRIWLLKMRDQTLLRKLIEKILTAGGLSLQREQRAGAELWTSSDERRGAALFLGGYAGLGRRAQLLKLLEDRRGLKLNDAPQLTQASRPSQTGVMLSLASTKEDSAEMMARVARALGTSEAAAAPAALNQLPLAVSVTSFTPQGLYVESHAPLGSFPLFAALASGAVSRE